MRWFKALIANATIGAVIYGIILGLLVMASSATGQTKNWSPDWEDKLAQVALFAIVAGALLGAGCTHGPGGNKSAGFATMVACVVGGSLLLYFPLSRASASPGAALLMLALFFTGPAVLVAGISQISAPDTDTVAEAPK